MSKRQLAAIMFTDIVGYTALMGKDSNKAMELVRKSKTIQKPLVEKHNGKWLKEMGDGAMAQFSSALDAVNCALEIQQSAGVDFDAKLRIGIHSGDITIENDDVYGDGVNVAARLESIADPGGIYISESIEKAIRGQSDVQAKYLGEINLKNVDYGVRTYALQGDGLPGPNLKEKQPASSTSPAGNKQRAATRSKVLIMLMSIIAVAILALVAYNKYWNKEAIDTSIIDRSIAVLPFENRSKLEEDEFFTDGFHDDLITQISKIREIKTISPTSVMEYRNTTKKIGTIGEELSVATILKGGVQRSGNQIRINIQLIDVKTDDLLWAETYTRELNAANVFVIYSEISQAIATALSTVLSREEKQDLEKFPTQNLAALEAYFHAKESSNKRTIEGDQKAIDYLQSAVKSDPSFAIAYAKLGMLTLDKFWWAGLPVKEQIVKGKSFIEMAMHLDSTISEVQMANGYLKSYEKDVRKAELVNYASYEKDLHGIELAYQKAIDLNPNNAKAYAAFGNFYLSIGKKEQGIGFLFKSRELDPLDFGLGVNLANALLESSRFEEARQIGEEIIARRPDFAQAYGTLADVAFSGDHELAETLRLLYKMNTLNLGTSFQSIRIGWIYDHLGEKERATAWLKHALLISPNNVQAIMARGTIYEIDGEYNKAYEEYLNGTATIINDVVGQMWMFQLMEMGIKTDRTDEVINYYRKRVPNLFQSEVLIDESNFIMSFALGRLLKAKGKDGHSDYLFKESLKVAQIESSEDVRSSYNNWEGRIYLAMGNNEAALASFITLVEEGVHSDQIVRDPVYAPLYEEPEFQRGMEIMKTRLEEERAIVKQMEARGELDIPLLPDN